MMQAKLSLNRNSLGCKGASFFPTPGLGFYSPLSAALFSVLLQAGSHGLSVCEALKKLVRQGYSRLLNSDVHTRAVQVKSALRSCPAFKEIEGKKFALRFSRQHDPAISPKQLCKREKVHGKRRRKIDDDCLNDEGPSCRPMAALERDLGVQGPGKQTRIVQEEGDMPLDGKKQGSIQRCCPLDPKHCGCIQHTSLGSLYSDCGNWSGREDIKESAYVLEGKDSGKVPCHSNDANRGDKLLLGRCRRTDGKRWRCTKEVQPGSIYCEHHHIMRRGGYKAKVVDAIKAGETLLPSIRPSEGLSGTCVLKEEAGLCSEPPKLASGSLQASTAQPVVATSCNLSANEEQCETKPFLYTLESQNLEDAWKLKPEEKLAEPGHSVRTMAAILEGQKEIPPALCILEEDRHKLDEHVDVERSKEVANSAGHGPAGTNERIIDEEKLKAKPDLNTLEEEVPRAEEEKGEDHHSSSKASAKGLEKVFRADVASQLQVSVIPFKALADKDVDGESEEVPVKPSRLAAGPLGGSVAQIVTSSSDILVEEKVRKVHKEVRHFAPRLEEDDLDGEQSSKKKPKLIGHGQSVLLEKHEEQEETKPDQHILEKPRYEEAKQEKASKLHVVKAHNLEDEPRLNETVRLAGHGQMVIPEKTVHQGQESAKMDSPVSAPDGLDHVQKSQEDSMPGFYRSSMMWDARKEVSHGTSEDGSNAYRGKGFHVEPSKKMGEMKVSAMPLSSSRNPKRSLVDQGDPSLSGRALFLDGSLHVSTTESHSPRSRADPPSQCHKKDGKGWHCSRQCKPGCIYCDHHQGQLSKSSTNGKKKMILQLELDKHVLATCLTGGSETQILRVAVDMPETLVKGLKTKVSHSTSRPPEGTTTAEDNDALRLGRCHRKDGKGWQCAQECKHGSIYCDRHQRQRSKSRFPRVHSQHKLVFSKGPDVQSLGYISDKYTKDKQLALPAIHITNSGLEHESKPLAKSHEVETRSGKEDDLGSALLSLRTPTRALHGSCPREAKTSEQVGKAENSPKKCHRRDGKKWQCSQLCMPGYNHCEHHQGRGRKVKVKT